MLLQKEASALEKTANVEVYFSLYFLNGCHSGPSLSLFFFLSLEQTADMVISLLLSLSLSSLSLSLFLSPFLPHPRARALSLQHTAFLQVCLSPSLPPSLPLPLSRSPSHVLLREHRYVCIYTHTYLYTHTHTAQRETHTERHTYICTHTNILHRRATYFREIIDV